jgi:hypothetical protein
VFLEQWLVVSIHLPAAEYCFIYFSADATFLKAHFQSSYLSAD